jgi:transcriptional regulator with XRE-family HTH domain
MEQTPTPKKLSERVKDALAKLGQRPADLARATGKSKPTIAKLLAGRYDGACPLDIYLPVKRALGLRGEEPAAALHVTPLEAKPRAERKPRTPKPNAYNEAAILGKLAALEAGQARILIMLKGIAREKVGTAIRELAEHDMKVGGEALV